MKYIKIFLFFLVFTLNFVLLNAQNVNDEKLRLADSYEKNGEIRSTLKIYEELYRSNKSSQNIFEGIVRCNKSLNQFSDLVPIIEERLEKYKTARNYTLYGEILWASGKSNEANKAWDEAIATDPKNVQTYDDVAKSQTGLRLFDKSITTLLKGRDKLNTPKLFSEQLSFLYITTGNFKLAADEVLNLYEQTRNAGLAQGRLSAILNNPESKGYLNEVLKKRSSGSDDPEFKRLYAWYLRAVGKYDEAFDQYKTIDNLINTKGYEVLNFANNSMHDGQYDIAQKAFEFLIDKGRSNPYIINALFGFARTLESKIRRKDKISREEIEDVIGHYRKIIKEFANSSYSDDSKYRIAVLYNQQLNDNEKAIIELKDLIAKNTNKQVSAMGMLLLGDIFVAQGQLDDAKITYNGLTKYYKMTASAEYQAAKYKLTEIEFFTGNIDSSLAGFSEVAGISNSDYANDALEKISLIEQNKESTKGLNTYAQAELKERQKKFDQAITLFYETTNDAPGTDLADRSYIRIAKIEMNLRKFDSCRKTLSSIIEKNPDTIYGDLILLLQGDSYSAESNKEAAMKAYTDMLADFPRSIYLEEAREKIRHLRDKQM